MLEVLRWALAAMALGLVAAGLLIGFGIDLGPGEIAGLGAVVVAAFALILFKAPKAWIGEWRRSRSAAASHRAGIERAKAEDMQRWLKVFENIGVIVFEAREDKYRVDKLIPRLEVVREELEGAIAAGYEDNWEVVANLGRSYRNTLKSFVLPRVAANSPALFNMPSDLKGIRKWIDRDLANLRRYQALF